MKPNFLILAGSIALLAATSPLHAVTFTWDGGGANDNINTAANWTPDGAPVSNISTTDLVFDGTVRLTPNFSAVFSANSLTFNNNAAVNAFTFGGSTLTIGAGGIVNNDANTQTFNNAVSLGAATSTFNAASGALVFNGLLTLGANALTVSGGQGTTFGNAISGTGSITKSGAGTLTLNASATAIGADFNVNAGTMTLAPGGGPTQTFSSTSTITVAGGVLNINENAILDAGAQLSRTSGSVNIASGKTLTLQGGSDFLFNGFTLSGGNLTASGAGSTVQLNGNNAVGGGSTLRIQSGASCSATGFLDVGNGSSGMLVVDGSGSSLTTGSESFWGNGGGTAFVTFSNNAIGTLGAIDLGPTGSPAATLDVLSGADVTSGALSLMFGLVDMTVDGIGSTWSINGANLVTVGSASGGALVLNVQNSGTFTTGTGLTTVNATGTINIVGGNFNANGNVTLNGTGAQLTRNAAGAFTLAAGRLLTIQAGADATFDGSYGLAGGNLTVTGSGSTFSLVSGGALSANTGSTVAVQSGGSITVAQLNLGSGTSGTLTVDGPGSTAANTSSFNTWGTASGSANVTFSNNAVGNFTSILAGTNSGTATVQVLLGADMTVSGPLSLGVSSGSANVTVDGAGSTWTQAGSVSNSIGAAGGGSATVNVQNGGTFTTGTMTVGPTGEVNINGGTFSASGILSVSGGRINRLSGGGFDIPEGSTLSIVSGGDVNLTGSYFGFGNTINVTGAGSTLAATSDVILSANVVASITSGGEIRADQRIILGGGGGAMTMTVAGSGALLRGIGGTSSILGEDGGDVTLTLRSNASAQFGGGLELATRGLSVGADVDVSIESGSTLMANAIFAGTTGGIIARSATITVDGIGSSLSAGTGGLVLGATGSSTGSLTLQNSGSYTSIGGTSLNQTGTLTINGGSADLGVLSRNGGTLNFNSGLLSFGGNLTVGTGGLLGTSLTLASDRQLTLTGTTTIDLAHTLTLNGGTLRTGALVNNGTFDFQRGTLGVTGAGGFNIGTGALGSIVTLGVGTNLVVTNATTVATGALLRVDGGGFSGGNITNNGTIDHRDGTLNFTGTVTNAAGSRMFVGGLSWNTGNINNAGRITLQNGIGLIGGTGSLTNTGLITGDGTIERAVTNGASGSIRGELGKTLSFTGSFAANAGTLSLDGGTLDFANAIANAATGFISGTGKLYTGGLTNNGVMAFSGGNADVHGDVVNASGARIVTGSLGAATTFFDDVVHNGMEIFTGAGASTVFFGAVSGAGPFTGTGTVYSIGDLRPGNSPALVSYGGSLVLGNGTLTMELGGLSRGSQYDALNIANSFATDGALALVLFGGFSPALGATFNLFDAASTTGAFDSLILPALAQYLTWDTSELYTTGEVSVSTTLTPIEQWRLLHFGSPDNVGDGADNNDFDRDGSVNLLEYGLAMDPKVPNVEGLPALGTVNVAGTDYVTLTIKRPLSATDISYRFQVGSTLLPSNDGSLYTAGGNVPSNAFTSEVSRTNDGTIETIVVRDNTAISAAVKRFMRLKVTNP